MNKFEELFKKAFALQSDNRYKKIDEGLWVFRGGQQYGAAIEVNKELTFNAGFAHVHMYTDRVKLDGEVYYFLKLSGSSEGLRDEFALICVNFGCEENRPVLLTEPKVWWERWRKLMGNAVARKTTHGVLGELLILEYLLNRNYADVEWSGPESGVQDIQTSTDFFEVKTTTVRYKNVITISGLHQLERENLYLIFVRVEPSVKGESINFAVDRLVKKGVTKEVLEKKLKKIGYVEGRPEREEKFNILEVLQYEVNEEFPKITNSSFALGKKPDDVIQLTYDLDIGSCKSEKIVL